MAPCDACNGTGRVVDLAGSGRPCVACDAARRAKTAVSHALVVLGRALNDYWRGDDTRMLSPGEWRALATVLEDVEMRGLES